MRTVYVCTVYCVDNKFLIGRIIFLLDLSDYSLLAYFAAVAALNVLLLKIFSQPRAAITLRTMPYIQPKQPPLYTATGWAMVAEPVFFK